MSICSNLFALEAIRSAVAISSRHGVHHRQVIAVHPGPYQGMYALHLYYDGRRSLRF